MQKQFTTGIVCRFSHHPPPQPRLALVEAGGSSSTGRGSTHAPILGPALYAALSVPDVCASDLGRAKLWPPNVRWRYLHAPTSSERRAVVYRNGGDAFRHYFQLTHLMRAETRRAQQPWMGAHQQSAPNSWSISYRCIQSAEGCYLGMKALQAYHSKPRLLYLLGLAVEIVSVLLDRTRPNVAGQVKIQRGEILSKLTEQKKGDEKRDW